MRIFADHEQAIKELLRELKELGITVPISHMQDKMVKGDKDYYTRELIGYSYKVSQADKKLDEMVRFLYPDKEGDDILNYCQLELQDRIAGVARNPGDAHKSRYSLWEEFLEDEQKFSYTYSERISDPALETDQIQAVINELTVSPDSRQAIVQIFNYLYDDKNIGGKHRIPCSLHYQFLLRNKKLHGIYCMRSNDLLTHYVVDIWLACKIQMYIAEKLNCGVGSFTYFGGSMHAYAKDFPRFVF
jgi:thymidylate synthase